MEEFLVSSSKRKIVHRYHHHLLLPDIELIEPPPLFHPPFSNALRPFRRGPMYSTYSKLRDRLRWQKKVRHAPSTPIPLTWKRSGVPCSVDRSFSLSNENRKPPLRFDAFMTPPPPIASKPELRKSVSVSVRRIEDKKIRPGTLFSVRRSFSVLNELKDISTAPVSGIKEEGRRGQGANKGSLRKSVVGLECSKLMKATA